MGGVADRFRSSNHRPDRLDPLDVLFATIVETSATIASTSKRSEKTRLLAELLGALDPAEVVPVVGFLTGDLHQGSIGIGWAAVSEVGDSRASASTLQVGEIDATITELDSITGTGSRRRRRDTLDELFSRATEAEADFLRRLFIGELRQGANQGVMTDAVARASGIKAGIVRRAVMLAGDLGQTALVALTAGEQGVSDVGLRVLLSSPCSRQPRQTCAKPLQRSTVRCLLSGSSMESVFRCTGPETKFSSSLGT